MNLNNSLPSPATAPIDQSTILRRLRFLASRMQRIELLSGQLYDSGLKIFTSKYVLLNLDSESPLALMSNLASLSVVVDLRAKIPLATAEDEVRSRHYHKTSLNKFAKEWKRLLSQVGVSTVRSVQGMCHSEVFTACA